MSEQPAAEAIEEAHYCWSMFATAKAALEQAEWVVRLANAMGDLVTYHPGYDDRTGTLPWQREDEE